MLNRPASVFRVAISLLLFAYAASAAEVRWRFEAGGRVLGKPTVHDDVLYFGAGNVVFALGRDGEPRWQREIEGEIAAAIVHHEEVLFVHSSAGLLALDLDGRPLWHYAATDRGPLVDGRTWGWGERLLADAWAWYRSAPLVMGDAVFFGGSDGVHAVAKATGERLWQAPVGPVTADLAWFEDTVIVAGWNNNIYALEGATGKLRWRYATHSPSGLGADWQGYVGCHLTPLVHNGQVLVGNRGTYFYSLDAASGRELWRTKVGASWIGSPAVVVDDAVYYGLSDGNAVMGHRLANGAQTLFFQTGGAVFAQPLNTGGHLVVGTLTGRLFAIDTRSGEGREIHNLGPDEVDWAGYFDPALVPEELDRYQGNVWALDRLLTSTQAIVSLAVAEETLYVGTGSGFLYALELGPDD